jgi:hypothetical protein
MLGTAVAGVVPGARGLPERWQRESQPSSSMAFPSSQAVTTQFDGLRGVAGGE